MAANTSLVINVIGQAWIRDADGTLTPLQKGMKIPADAHIVTGNSGSSVQLQPIGQDPLTVGQERDIKISADVAQPDVSETDSAARLQADTDTARIIAALDAGDDPFDELDPTAAVLQGGSDDAGGSSFTRLMSIVETTTPLALEYPRPSWPTPDEIRLGGFGGAGNRSPELSVDAALLTDQLNDDSDMIDGLNVGQYFSDPDGHTLTFSATGLPPGLTINPVTGVISGQLDSSASQGGPNSNGIYSVVVTATDPYGATVSLPFTWTALNPPPIAEDDYATTEENTVVTGNVLEGDPITGEGQDTDPDGDTLTVVEVTNADGDKVPAGTPVPGANPDAGKGGGTLVLRPDGSYTFEPGTDFDYLAVGETAVITFTYKISDGDGGFDTATLTITVEGTNDAPLLAPDVYDPANAAEQVVESGVRDDGTDEPNTPFAGRDEARGNVLANDTDPDASDVLHVVGISHNGQSAGVPAGASVTLAGTYGTLEIHADGGYTYTLDNTRAATEALAPGERADEVFEYTASDGHVERTTTLTIVVHGTNDRPVIDDTAGTTGEVVEAGHEEPGKSTVTGELAATDVDAGHQSALTWHLVDGQGNVLNAPTQTIETDYGTLTLDSATGEWTYTLDDGKPATQKLAEGKAHPEEFTVRVQDPEGAWDVTTIKVTVTGTNDAPVIVGADDEGSVRELPETDPNEENYLHVKTGEVRFSDVDANADEHQVSVAPKPGNEKDYGTFTATITAEGVVTWTFEVEDSEINELAEGDEPVVQEYVITITDGHGAPVEQEVRITITGTNDAPVVTSEAEQHEGQVTEHTESDDGHNTDDHQVTGTIKFADDDLTDKHTVSKVSKIDNPDDYLGKLTYAFNQETKEIEWTFIVPDADLNTLNKGDKVTQVYTFTVDDGNGGSVTQDVTITITGTNDIPEITADSVLSGTVTEQGVGNENASPIVTGSLKGDDVDSDASLSWSLIGGVDTTVASSAEDDNADRKQELEGTYGKITLSTSGEWVYELDNVKAQKLAQGEEFLEEFVVRVYDEHGAYSQDVIQVTVTGTNDAPTAIADSDHVVESGVAVGGNDPLAGVVQVDGDVLVNDKDEDSDSDGFRVTGVVLGTDTDGQKDVNQEDVSVGTEVKGAYGTLTIFADGTYTYVLADGAPEVNSLHAGQKVQDIFTYVMTDGDGASSSTTLTINVTGTNDQPVINLDKSIVAKEVTEQGADNPAATDTVEGVLVADDPDSDGHVQTWQIVDADGKLIDTIDGTYGVLTLNESTGKWTYTLDNSRSATQALGNDDRPKETFRVRVTDKHGAYAEQELVVTVQGSNDAPTAVDHVVEFDEDPTEGTDGKSTTGNLLEGAKNPEGGDLTVISFKIDGDDTVHSVSGTGEPVPVKVGDEEIGTFTLMPNGDYVFTPKEHYSGEVPVITYTIQEPANNSEDGLTADGTLTFEITPVADAPGFGEDADKEVKEDNTIPLGLTVPVVVDDTDHNKDGEGDNPELLGVITISGLPSGASLIYSDNGSEKTIQGQGDQPIKIIIIDGPHTADALADTDAIKLTEDQFQALKLLPNEHDHKNIKLDISVTSYEVDDGGNQLSGIDGATTTITRDIDVRAVTDEVELKIDANVDGVEKRGDVFHISTDEDVAFKLSDALNAIFEDLDGSEERWIEIAGLEPGSMVTFGGETIRVTASNPVVKIPAFDTSGGPQDSGMDSFPEFSLKPPANWSGQMENVTVTLKAQDHDGDSVFTEGPSEGQPYVAPEEKDSVKFHFDVAPVADGVSLGAAVGDEDTLINVLENVRKIDTDGSEQITKFELTLSKADIDAGWSFVDEGGDLLQSNDKYDVVTQVDGSVKIIFKGDDIVFKGSGVTPIYLKPPQDSNTDIKLGTSIETIDMAAVGGTALDIRTQDGELEVRVRPVAETVYDGGVTMTGGHEYGPGISGTEDSWFALNSGGFDLKEGWSNRDEGEPGVDTEDGEQTFALLTPELIKGTDDGDSASGSSFRYKDADGSYQNAEYRIDLGGYLVPMEYLDTVEFQPPADVAGEFKIQVQAYTVDADHEGRFDDSTAVSGEAWLTGIVINPVADGVQSLGLDPAYGREDNEIALSIRPSSKDPSETFDVTIGNLPVGSTLSYDGTVLAVVNGSVTIKDFDPQKELLFTPPEDASGRFDLKVEAVAVDTLGDVTDVLGPASGTLRVNVKGVADEPELELNTITVSEGELDGHGGEDGQGISLGTLVKTAELTDKDDSETLSFKITGLPDGFTVEGASFAGGQGEGRVWTFTEDQLQNVKVNTPEHFSGKLPGTLTAISTERDGDSNSSVSKDFSDYVTITPTPEVQQSLTKSATITEDQAGELNFSLDVSHGDDNEEVTAVYLNQVQLDNLKLSDNGGLQLFVGGAKIEEADLDTEEIDGVMHYVIPQDMLDQITAQAGPNFAHNDDGSFTLDLKFDVIDKSNDGSIESDPVRFEGQYDITVTPVTDPMAADLQETEGGVQVDDQGAAQWTISTTGEHTAAITLTKPEDATAVGEDYDGSERLTQFIIDGAPEGMLVKGIQVDGGELLGTAVLVGPNKWVVSLPEHNALDFDGPLTVNVVFEATGNLATGQNDLSITAISQDRGADNTAAAQVGLTLTTGLGDGPGDGEAIEISWERKDDFAATEDAEFALSDLIDASVTLPGGDQATADYSIVLTLPEGSNVELLEGAAGTVTQMSIDADGDEVWVITATGTSADLGALLGQVRVTPPADWNDNKRTDEDDFFVDATLNVVMPNGQQDSGELKMTELPVTPQTDKADITVDFYTVDADGVKTADTPTEGSDVGITVTVKNDVDGPLTVGEQVYIRVPTGLSGEFFHNGDLVTPESVSGVDGLVDGDYLVLPLTGGQQVVIGNGESLELDLVFSPSDSFIGGTSIDLDVWVPVKEQGSSDNGEEGWVLSDGKGSDTIGIVNNGYDITVGVEDPDSGVYSVTGDETSSDDPSGVIVLVEQGAGALIDDSGREAVHSVRLDGLSNDFLAFYKDEAGNRVQATNAGTDADGKNVWTIPTVNGGVPEISVLPPKHWSGTLEDLRLTVLSGESSLKDTDQHESTATFNLVVDPVADGLESLSASSAFGREGDIIRLNLNAVMVDAVKVDDLAGSGAVPDESTESITLKLTGLGEHAAFYIGDALIDGTDGLAFTYDSGDDVYTISGLSQDDISKLGVLQAVTAESGNQQKLEVKVEAWTVESGAPDTPSEKVLEGTFDLTLYAQQATSGDDELLFDGTNLLDGGDGHDTVWLRFGEDIDFDAMRADDGDGMLLRNIETLDLTRPGFDHELSNLSVQDVLDMTDDRNILTIKADDGDVINLLEGWERSEDLSVKATDGQIGKDVYVDISGDSSAQLHIEADPAFLKQIAESLKTDSNG